MAVVAVAVRIVQEVECHGGTKLSDKGLTLLPLPLICKIGHVIHHYRQGRCSC